MTRLSETVECLIETYGREAFFHHREEVYGAIKAVCLCAEFFQNQSEWNRMRPCTGNWEKKLIDEYLKELRELQEEMLWKLWDELDSRERWMGMEIPLKKFLMQGILGLIQEAESDSFSWTEYMDTQIRTDQYTGIQAFLEAVYIKGLFEVLKFQKGINYHVFVGDYRDAEYILHVFNDLVPEEEWENYGRYSQELLTELENKRIDEIKQVLKEREVRMKSTEQTRGKILVLEEFQKEIEAMDDDAFEQFVCGQFYKGDDLYRWKFGTAWDEEYFHHACPACLARESNRIYERAGMIQKVRKLGELFLYGDSHLKERLFRYLLVEEQMIVMEQWMCQFYPETTEELAERLRDIRYAVRSSRWLYDEEEQKNLFPAVWWDSMERILGRKVREKDVGDVIWEQYFQ